MHTRTHRVHANFKWKLDVRNGTRPARGKHQGAPPPREGWGFSSKRLTPPIVKEKVTRPTARRRPRPREDQRPRTSGVLPTSGKQDRCHGRRTEEAGWPGGTPRLLPPSRSGGQHGKSLPPGLGAVCKGTRRDGCRQWVALLHGACQVLKRRQLGNSYPLTTQHEPHGI